MKQLLIRSIHASEIKETVRIYLECVQGDFVHKPEAFRMNPRPLEEARECEDWLYHRHPHNAIWAAYQDQTMAGYIAAGPNIGEPWDHGGEVTGFFIRKPYRNRGIGLGLLRVACQYLLRLGYIRLAIYNAGLSASNAFYRQLGGKVVLEVTQYVQNQPVEVEVFGWELPHLTLDLEQRLRKYPGVWDCVRSMEETAGFHG